MNFVNALERLPEIIRLYEERTEKMRKDVPLLEAIVAKPWGKDDELKALKSELAVLDRKITAELAPKHDEKDGEEAKRENQTQPAQIVKDPAQSPGPKESMVAEPVEVGYRHREPLSDRIVIGGCGFTPPGGYRAAGLQL